MSNPLGPVSLLSARLWLLLQYVQVGVCAKPILMCIRRSRCTGYWSSTEESCTDRSPKHFRSCFIVLYVVLLLCVQLVAQSDFEHSAACSSALPTFQVLALGNALSDW